VSGRHQVDGRLVVPVATGVRDITVQSRNVRGLSEGYNMIIKVIKGFSVDIRGSSRGYQRIITELLHSNQMIIRAIRVIRPHGH